MSNQVMVQRVIWAALLVAVVVYCLIAFMLGQTNAAQPFAENFRDVFVKMMYAVAIVMFGVAFFMRARLREMGRPPRLYNIVCWALLESVTIYGLVPAFTHHDWRLVAGPAMLSIAGLVMTFPQADASVVR